MITSLTTTARPRPRRAIASLATASLTGVALLCAVAVTATRGDGPIVAANGAFEIIASFDVSTNGSSFAGEIAVVSSDDLIAYTDEPGKRIGIVDISDPSIPTAAGAIDVNGTPRDVVANSGRLFVTVDASAPDSGVAAGALVVIDPSTRRVTATIDLRGQPAGLAISPDGRFVAVAVENRSGSKDVAGRVAVVDVEDQPANWTMRDVALSEAGQPGPRPRPVGVAINDRNIAAVTLQDNNAIAFVDVETAALVRLVDAGTVRVESVDATEEELGPQGHGVISLTESLTRRREPAAVAWLDAGSIVVANEGSDPDPAGSEGGGRGFSILTDKGGSRFESGASFEHAAISVGHFDPERAANRGVEPESVAVGEIGGLRHMVVAAEHANVAAVYLVESTTSPRLLQMLPTGNRPADVAIDPDEDLIVISASEQHDEGEYPALLTIYGHETSGRGPVQLISAAGVNGVPIPWLALSGLAVDPQDGETMYAVSDASLAEAAMYRIDGSVDPALVVERHAIKNADGTIPLDLDLEGIAIAADSTAWLVSEGRSSFGSERVPQVLHVDRQGMILESVVLPPQLTSAEGLDAGLEGVAVLSGALFVAQQRPWATEQLSMVRIWRLDLVTRIWTVGGYPLEASPGDTSWVGVSDLSPTPDGRLAVLERDNVAGPSAAIKRVYSVNVTSAAFVDASSTVVPLIEAKTLIADLLEALRAGCVWVPNKPEGLTFDRLGRVVVVTDNDGLDDAIGQTMLVRL